MPNLCDISFQSKFKSAVGNVDYNDYTVVVVLSRPASECDAVIAVAFIKHCNGVGGLSIESNQSREYTIGRKKNITDRYF